MAVRKSDLYSSLWEAANKLRGWMDATSYKDYVLVILFVKYVTDKAKAQADSLLEVPEWGSFDDMIEAKWKEDIWERLNKIIAKLAEVNELKWVIDRTDFDNSEKLWSGKEKVDRLSDLIGVFQNKNLDFSKNRAEWDDILGDVYEYFMKNFATEAGKSKGQFYTPSEVSRIMAKIIGVSEAKSADQTVYDMTCWSGSLLLKAGSEASVNLTLYWQEKDPDVAVLARMNTILHNQPTAEIYSGNTLSSPGFTNGDNVQTFDYCVANPPFSDKDWMIWLTPENDIYHRFVYGIPPEKNWDYAFLSHMLKSLKQTGKWAIILPHWVLFRWDAEWNIRKEIIKHWLIKWIIGLPANLFYWTGIPACIIMIDKEWAANRKWIFMIQANKWFIKDGSKNRLREQDIHKIVTTFLKQEELPKYSRFVTNEEIEANDYNLNIPRYIDTQEEEDIQDIKAHLEWWIPKVDIEKFENYWKEFPTLKSCLFEPINSDYVKCKIPEDEIQETISGNDEFRKYSKDAKARLEDWTNENRPKMRNINKQTKAKDFIVNIAEDLLHAYKPDPLIQSYDVYQHLMDYRDETMQDDVYILIEDWWKAEVKKIIEVKEIKKWKDKWKTKETYKWWTCDLLPKELVAKEYFKSECDELERYREQLEEATSRKEEMQEEYGETWQALEWITSQATAKATLKAHKWNPTFEEDNKIIEEYLDVLARESEAKKEVKALEKELDDKLCIKYPQLTEEEVKDLVVNKKWLVRIDADVELEQDKVSQVLTRWIRNLVERYGTTMWEINKEVDEYEAKVEEHLRKMWFSL